MTAQVGEVKRTVGRQHDESPLDRVWRLSQFLRHMKVLRYEAGRNGERIRKVVGRPR